MPDYSIDAEIICRMRCGVADRSLCSSRRSGSKSARRYAVILRSSVLAVANIGCATENDGRAKPGESVRNLCEEYKAKYGRPKEPEVVERHHNIRCGLAQRLRKEQDAKSSRHSARCEERELLPARPLPNEEGWDERERG